MYFDNFPSGWEILAALFFMFAVFVIIIFIGLKVSGLIYKLH